MLKFGFTSLLIVITVRHLHLAWREHTSLSGFSSGEQGADGTRPASLTVPPRTVRPLAIGSNRLSVDDDFYAQRLSTTPRQYVTETYTCCSRDTSWRNPLQAHIETGLAAITKRHYTRLIPNHPFRRIYHCLANQISLVLSGTHVSIAACRSRISPSASVSPGLAYTFGRPAKRGRATQICLRSAKR